MVPPHTNKIHSASLKACCLSRRSFIWNDKSELGVEVGVGYGENMSKREERIKNKINK